jgi:hypothetical protein
MMKKKRQSLLKEKGNSQLFRLHMKVKGKILLMTHQRRKGRNQSPMRTGKSHLLKRRRIRQSLRFKETHRRVRVKKMRRRRKRKMKERGLKLL